MLAPPRHLCLRTGALRMTTDSFWSLPSSLSCSERLYRLLPSAREPCSRVAATPRLLATGRARRSTEEKLSSSQSSRGKRFDSSPATRSEESVSWWKAWLRRVAQSANGQEPSLLLRLLGYNSKESRALRLGKLLYRGLVRQAESWHMRLYGAPQGESAKEPPFAAWVQLVSLHMWMTIYRLRAEGDFGRDVSQAIYENFWPQLRRRLVEELGLGLVQTSKHLRECEHMFYGAAIRYDEAWLNKNVDAFTAALQRNIPQISAEQARALYEYTAQQLQCSARRPVDMIWQAPGLTPPGPHTSQVQRFQKSPV
ncbi:hypothetical protein CCYA_CCYA06G1872 [Cyanidiococcus yangmingshanensis]|nr:hypothetical protein CCYA_CCYA06G1872 [Cyanidiococcus yangmingshanensis]